MEPDHKEAWVPGCVPGDARHIKHMAMVLHVFIYSPTEPASAEPTMYYGCDELQVYRGGENSLIFAIIFALLGLTVQSHTDVTTHDVLLSMTLGRSSGVGNATAVFLPGKFHGQRSLVGPRVGCKWARAHTHTHTHTQTWHTRVQ